jgi:hypothetical protein
MWFDACMHFYVPKKKKDVYGNISLYIWEQLCTKGTIARSINAEIGSYKYLLKKKTSYKWGLNYTKQINLIRIKLQIYTFETIQIICKLYTNSHVHNQIKLIRV